MLTALPSSVTRRDFMTFSCGLLFARMGWSEIATRPILHWPLDQPVSPIRETITGTNAEIIAGTGRLEWVSNAPVSLPRLDGYSVWIEHHFKEPITLNNEIGISAWIALESFPVTTASVIEWGEDVNGVRVAIDRLGFVLVCAGKGTLKSDQPIARGRWVHLASSLSRDGELSLFIDGHRVKIHNIGEGIVKLNPIAEVYIGRAAADERVAKVFRTDVLNGLIRAVRVYRAALSIAEIESLAHEFQPQPASLATDPSWFQADIQRPLYHAVPPRAWTNEPHGLIHWRGQYHLFYQKNPNGPYWGHIHWGHMTSPDLWRWTEQPLALVPGPGPDSEGCWSGSAIVANDSIVVFYTGGDGNRSTICMACSHDGITFTKHPGNPVIEAPPSSIGVKEFRDPFVWRQGTEYRMIIGSGIEGKGGTALLYRSADLITWTYLRPLLVGDKSNSGIFWEMPIFVAIGDHHMLIVCEVPGRASYWVGKWVDDQFKPNTVAPQRLDLFNHYLSPTPYEDASGRVVTVGIVPETRASIEQWQAGWAHLYGLPRELTLDAQQRLHQNPSSEVLSKFTPILIAEQLQPLSSNWTVVEADGDCLAVKMRIERKSSTSIAIALRSSPDHREETLIRYDWTLELLVLDRSRSSLNPHTLRNLQEVAYSPATPGVVEIMIFIDRSVLEVFLDGQFSFTSRIYPVLPGSVGIALRSEEGEAALASMVVSGLTPANIDRSSESHPSD